MLFIVMTLKIGAVVAIHRNGLTLVLQWLQISVT